MEEFDIKRFLKTALAKKAYVISIVVISIIIGIIYTFFLLVPKYKATTKMVLTQVEGTTTQTTESITSSDITLNKNLVSVYGEILKSKKVVSKVIENLGLEFTVAELQEMISISSGTNAEVLDVSVTSKDPIISTNITNELADVFVDEVSEMYKINNVNILDKAEIPNGPCNVNHIKDLAIFTVLGIFLAAGFVLLLYMVDTTIKMEEDVEAYTGLTILTSIPLCENTLVKKGEKIKPGTSRTKMSDANKRRTAELVAFEDPKSTISETFRTLRANLAFTQTNKKMKNILLTSSEMSEGKSFVSANVAVTFAKADKKVIIVDADMRKGRQHNIFKVVNTQGLSNCLSALDDSDSMNLENLARYIKTTKVSNLHIMTSGDRPPNPAELISSSRMTDLLKLLNKVYDVVIIDGTPSMIVSDSIILSKFVDTTIVVAACRSTKIESLQKVKKSIENVGGKIAGVILNKVPMSEKAYNNRYYYSDAAKEENVERSKEDIKTVKDILSTAVTVNEPTRFDAQEKVEEPTKITKTSFEDMSEDERNKLIGDYYLADNKLLQYKMENLSNEISSIKTLFLQAMVNNPKQLAESASTEDIAELKKEIKELRKIVESNKTGIVTEDIKKEFAEIKNMSEILLESQNSNKEKIDKFIEEYKTKKTKTKKESAE